MSKAWDPDITPHATRLGLVGWIYFSARVLALGGLVFGGLGVLALVRLAERPLFGHHRPLTPHITQFVCRGAFLIIGVQHRTEGEIMTGPGAVVANHTGWLDIFALNARKRIYFVSKDEVAGWPGIGLLARATGTLFIRRNQREARAHVETFVERLSLGHKLLFFPEGTSTDGRRVLPFKPTLFAAFFADGLRETLAIQPVSVIYRAAPGADPRQYGWWGDMDFAPHFVGTLGARKQGSVTICYHPPVQVRDFADRKSLASALEDRVRQGLFKAGVLDD